MTITKSILKSCVDPTLMQQVLELQVHQSKRKVWRRELYPGAEGVGAAVAGRKTGQHLPPGSAALPAMDRQRKAGHCFKHGGESEAFHPIKVERARRTRTARVGGRKPGGAPRASSSTTLRQNTNMRMLAHSHMCTERAQIPSNICTRASRGPHSLFLFSYLGSQIYGPFQITHRHSHSNRAGYESRRSATC